MMRFAGEVRLAVNGKKAKASSLGSLDASPNHNLATNDGKDV